MKNTAILDSGEHSKNLLRWSESLQLPLHLKKTPEILFYLTYHEDKLSLIRNDGLPWSPFSVDFLSNQMLVLKKTIGKHQPLGKAIGVKTGHSTRVLDLSLGWAKDAFSLLLLGCEVRGVEFNPVVWALVTDAYERALAEPETGELFKERFKIFRGDAFDFLRDQDAHQFDTIYLDPIFETSSKGSVSTKELQAISELYELLPKKPTTTQGVFQLAIERSTQRLVVKRSRLAPALLEPVSHQIYGKTIRFDVYIPKNLNKN